LKFVAIILALISLASGLVAARYWYDSGKVKIDPAWKLEVGGAVDRNIMGWVTGVMIAFNAVSQLNKKAALWTAASVLLSATSAVVGSFSN
jgi:uncharacterized membrane protein YfcA